MLGFERNRGVVRRHKCCFWRKGYFTFHELWHVLFPSHFLHYSLCEAMYLGARI